MASSLLSSGGDDKICSYNIGAQTVDNKKIAFQWPEQRKENSRKANFIVGGCVTAKERKTRAPTHKRALNGASVYLIKAPGSIEIVFINWSWEVGSRGHRQQASASEETNFVTWWRIDPDAASLWPQPCHSKKATMKRWNFIAFQRNCGFLCFYDRAERGEKNTGDQLLHRILLFTSGQIFCLVLKW